MSTQVTLRSLSTLLLGINFCGVPHVHTHKHTFLWYASTHPHAHAHPHPSSSMREPRSIPMVCEHTLTHQHAPTHRPRQTVWWESWYLFLCIFYPPAHTSHSLRNFCVGVWSCCRRTSQWCLQAWRLCAVSSARGVDTTSTVLGQLEYDLLFTCVRGACVVRVM